MATIKKDKKSWQKVSTKVDSWVKGSDASVVVMYLPRPTKNDRYPQIKFAGSERMKRFVEDEDVRQRFCLCAGNKLPLPAKCPQDIRNDMVILGDNAVHLNMENKRACISSFVKTYMMNKIGIQRDFWGVEGLTPPFWPAGMQFRSPNTCRNQKGTTLKSDDLTVILEHYIRWRGGRDTEGKGRETDGEGRETEEEGRETEEEGRETDGEGRETDGEGRETDGEGRKTEEEGRETDGEGRETEEEGRETDGEGRETDGKGRETEEEGRETDGEGRKTEGEGRETDGEGRKTDGEGRETDGEGRETDREGRKTEGEGRETEEEGRETDGEGRKTDGEGRKTDGEGRETEGEGRETDGEGRETDGEGRKTEGEGRETDGEGRETDGEGRKTEGEGRETEGDGRETEGGSREKADRERREKAERERREKAEGERREKAERERGEKRKRGEASMGQKRRQGADNGLLGEMEEVYRVNKFPPPKRNSEVRFRIGKEVLEAIDFETLEPRQWLNDKVINAFCRHMMGQNNRSRKNRVEVIPSYIGVMWDNDRIDEMLLHKHVFKECRWIFIPLNVRKSHWVLLAADVANRTVSILDSLSTKQNITYCDKFREFMGRRDCDDLDGVWENGTMQSNAQTDGHSCGVYVMLNCAMLMRGEKVEDVSPQHIALGRKYVTNYLMKHAVPLESQRDTCDLPSCPSFTSGNWVECIVCGRWCHYKCAHIKRAPKGDFFCVLCRAQFFDD